MRLIAFALIAIVSALPAHACPISKSGSSPCSKLNDIKYVVSRVYVRAAAAKPPAFDQAKTTKFLTGSRWNPIGGDLTRGSFQVVPRRDKERGPTLRFLDPTSVTTTPKSTKRLQLVLVREVTPSSNAKASAIVSVDGETFALVECTNGKQTTSCLILAGELKRDELFTGSLK